MILIFLYNLFLILLLFFLFPIVIAIVVSSHKRRSTFLPRLGITPGISALNQKKIYTQMDKPLWVHALSVGEVISVAPLVKRLRSSFQDKKIVFSASTKTGFEIAGKLFRDDVDLITFFPYDFLLSVKLAAKKIDPSIVIMTETDIWPNFIWEMKKRRVPVILVNARLSNRSFSGYKRVLFLSKSVFSSFSRICAQSAEDAERFRLLEIPLEKISITGNIKFDQQDQPVSLELIKERKLSMGIKPCQKIILAGSTHKGEETSLLEAFTRLKKDIKELLLVIAPRDPERAGTVCDIFKSAGFVSELMQTVSKTETGKASDVIIIDRIGVLKSLYALADVAFTGGSLVNRGGHNPLEPAAFSKPIIFGSDMSNFAQISDMLLQSSGAIQVADADGLYNAASAILKNDKTASKIGKNAFSVYLKNKGALDNTLDIIKDYL